MMYKHWIKIWIRQLSVKGAFLILNKAVLSKLPFIYIITTQFLPFRRFNWACFFNNSTYLSFNGLSEQDFVQSY